MKYFKIENQNDLILGVSDTVFSSGSGYYQVSSSDKYLHNFAKPGHFKWCVSCSNCVPYSGSANIDNIDEFDIVYDLYDANVIDYKKYRHWLQDYASENNFYSLSLNEQEECAQTFAVDKTERDTLYDITEQVHYGMLYHNKSVHSRKHRLARSIAILYNRLDEPDAKQVIEDMVHGVSGSDSSYAWKYQEFGIEGISEGDRDGLFDYMRCTSGSAFYGSGLTCKDYMMPIGGDTMMSLSMDLLMVLKSGSYNPHHCGYEQYIG